MLVRAQGTARTGERYQLTCTVTRNYGNVPTITWIDAGGQITSNSSRISLGPQVNNDIISSSVLLLNPLSVGDEGNYTCQANSGAEAFSYTYLVAVTASES